MYKILKKKSYTPNAAHEQDNTLYAYCTARLFFFLNENLNVIAIAKHEVKV